MNIDVARISEDEGLDIHHLYREGELALRGNESRLVGRPELTMQATRAGEKVRLVGSLTASVDFACDRCLNPLAVPIEQSFDLLYVPAMTTEEEKELGEDDLSIAFYQE